MQIDQGNEERTIVMAGADGSTRARTRWHVEAHSEGLQRHIVGCSATTDLALRCGPDRPRTACLPVVRDAAPNLATERRVCDSFKSPPWLSHGFTGRPWPRRGDGNGGAMQVGRWLVVRYCSNPLEHLTVLAYPVLRSGRNGG